MVPLSVKDKSVHPPTAPTPTHPLESAALSVHVGGAQTALHIGCLGILQTIAMLKVESGITMSCLEI